MTKRKNTDIKNFTVVIYRTALDYKFTFASVLLLVYYK